MINLSESVSPALKGVGNLRTAIARGYLIIAGFIILFLVWAGTLPLSSAAIATGVVGVAGQKKLVQHLDGGIVNSIHIKDGDQVNAGDVLATLAGEELQSRYTEIEQQAISISAELARWKAEQANDPTIRPSDWLRSHPRVDLVQASVITQENIFTARKAVFTDSLLALTHQLNQVGEQVHGAEQRRINLLEKQTLVSSEYRRYVLLEKRGLMIRSEVFDLEKDLAEIKFDIDDAASDVVRLTQVRAQIESEIATLKSRQYQESVEMVTKVHAELQSLKQQLSALRPQLDRLAIRSSIDGYVMNNTINTIGGVIKAGETLMEILPAHKKLIVESRVDPKDRDAVREGQKAEVRFTAFNQRDTKPALGTVKLISADGYTDPITQTTYYKTSIELDQELEETMPGVRLYPGMQADVLIITGNQTLLQYILSPLSRSFSRALREN